MQFRLALLTVVLIRHLTVFHDSDAPSVLPDAASITRDEESTSILVLQVRLAEGFAQWRTRILLMPADASRDFLFIYRFFIDIIFDFSKFFVFRVLCALAATWWLTRVIARSRLRCC